MNNSTSKILAAFLAVQLGWVVMCDALTPSLVSLSHERVQQRVASRARTLKRIRVLKATTLALVAIGGATLAYKFYHSSSSSMVSNPEPVTLPSQAPEISAAAQGAQVLAPRPLFWFEGVIPVTTDGSLWGAAKAIALVTAVSSFATHALDNVSTGMGSLLTKNRARFLRIWNYSLKSLQDASSEVEAAAFNLMQALELMRAYPVRELIDNAYYHSRLIHLYNVHIYCLEEFLALAAVQARQNNELQTYEWIMNPENGIVKSSQELAEHIHLYANDYSPACLENIEQAQHASTSEVTRLQELMNLRGGNAWIKKYSQK